MDQFKFSLGPYELFSAILGGFPLLLAICLLYSPIGSAQDLLPIIQDNSSVAISIVLLFFSYILGGMVQGMSWEYFRRLCLFCNQDYRYFGDRIQAKHQLLIQKGAQLEWKHLDFDERLVMYLRDAIGMPQKHAHLETRLSAYLREHNRQASISAAELHLANHIMYRSWSFGFCLLSFVLFLNIFRTPGYPFEQWVLPFAALAAAYLTFFRALRFKRWHNRVLFLGFYFAVENSADHT